MLPGVPRRQPIDDPPPAPHDLARHADEGVHEGLGFHPQHLPLLGSIPFLPASALPGSALAQRVYDDYIQRGTSAHRFDELKNGQHADRLSCHRFVANFWLLLLHTAAYNLLNALRDDDAIPAALRRAQPATWRTRLIKVAATVVQSARRVVVAIAGQWPHWPNYVAVSRRAGAMPAGP